MIAAFFDLDKTVIAQASMVAFGPTLYRAGLLSRWPLIRSIYDQMMFRYLGADEDRLERVRNAALVLTKGWDHAEVEAIVADALVSVIEPIVYDEALELIRQHQAEGHLVVIVSASPEEVVLPLAGYLGADVAIGSRAQLDEAGRYNGQVDRYVYGPAKAVVLHELALERGIDLDASHAYSDSATDVPMLEAVGHPVAVNPDRALARIARERGWEVRRFVHPVRLRDRVSMPGPATTATAGSGLGLLVVAGVAWWWWSRRRAAAVATPPAANPTEGVARFRSRAGGVRPRHRGR